MFQKKISILTWIIFKVRDNKLVLPSSVFPSKQETKIGLLNKAAPDRGPKIGWDPDIVAALDESCSDDDLEDNFMELANAEPLPWVWREIWNIS